MMKSIKQDSPFTFLLFYGRINKVVDEFHHTIGMRLKLSG